VRSLIGGLRGARAKPPIPYVPNRPGTVVRATGGAGNVGPPTEQHLAVMGSVSTLSAIVGRTSEATAGVNWHLYKTAPPGTPPEHRVEVTSHAALDLWNGPNDFFTRQELVETGQQHYELTGEEWWVVVKAGSLPLELWPVRPDRMRPVPSTDKFIAGYIYRSPDGDEIPLDVGEVIFIRRPNPLDIYRGLGVVQSLLVDLDSARFTAEWNRNFFLNSAEPGGIIQVDKRLSDDEYTEMVQRWREQHQGVAQAHRVAVLEQGQWIDRKFSIKDMQFPELRELTSEIIREGFGFPKPLLGTVTDVNRANAEAAEVMFGRWLLVPRLERIKQALNHDLLPMYGRTAVGLEFDYDSPVPEDAALAVSQLTAKTQAYVLLTSQGGVTPASASEVCGLPPLEHEEPAPVPAQLAAAGPVPSDDEPEDQQPADDDEPDDGKGQGKAADRAAALVHAAVEATARRLLVDALEEQAARPVAELPPPAAPTPPDDGTPATLPDGAGPDMAPVQAAWRAALAVAVAGWLVAVLGDDDARSRARHGVGGLAGRLVEQVRDAVHGRDLLALTRLTVDVSVAGDALGDQLVDVAEAAARHVVSEASAQGITVSPGPVDRQALRATGRLAAATLGDGLRISAAREAARVWGPGVPADAVAAQVADALATLTPAQPELVLGGALTAAEAAGREATMLSGPSAALYASEVNDSSRCSRCAAVDGKWVGNSDDPARPWRALYPVRGYVACLGRDRCRGGLVAIWRGGSDWTKWVEGQPVERGAA